MLKKLKLGFLFLIIFIPFTSINAQNEIKKIEMDIFINDDGHAKVIEKWDVVINEGTENYRSFKDLKKSTISNFEVSDETKQKYASIKKWNSNLNFNDKAYKSGLKKIKNGLELCWGISKYGEKTYTLSYTITNFVTQYTDNQVIYFKLLNLDQTVPQVKIHIASNYELTSNNTKIWAFGYNGIINFENGNIVLETKEPLTAKQYMVPLIKFEEDMFNLNIKSSKSFTDIYNEALKGTKIKNFSWKKLIEIINPFLFIIVPPMTFFLIMWYHIKIKWARENKGLKLKYQNLDFGKKGKLLPPNKEIKYWREIPCNKDLIKAYFIIHEYNIISEETLNQGIIGAFLLKWANEGLITISKDNNCLIQFNTLKVPTCEVERKLFIMMLTIVDNNKVLIPKALKKWCLKNGYKIKQWFELIIEISLKRLEEEKLILSIEEPIKKEINLNQPKIIKKVDDSLYEEALRLKGLKKFLLNFSNISKKEHFDVHLWNEYLIYAQLLGIADKVISQFKELYPNFNQVSILNPNNSIQVIKRISTIGYQNAIIGYNRNLGSNYRGGSRSSGGKISSGGGGSSFKGGGRSAGGSSGGGFR